VKKLAYIFILFPCLLLSFSAFAYISGKAPVQEKVFYCPSQIVCAQANDLKSCQYKTPTPDYWGSIRNQGQAGIQAGTYAFNNARGGGRRVMDSSCVYSAYGIAGNISLPIKFEANPEAYEGKTTKWIGNSQNLPFSCTSNQPTDCPFKEAPVLNVTPINLNPEGVVGFSVDGVEFTIGGSQEHFLITYESVPICWDRKFCKIDLHIKDSSSEFGKLPIGSITVDMDNKMKLVSINSIPSSKIDIFPVEPFNSVEIKLSPTRPLLEVYNLTEIDRVFAVVGGSPIAHISRKSSIVSSRLLALACANWRICKIDLKAGAGLIGSVVVNIEDGMMTITSIQETRSSEIEIRKINDHHIEVRYPDFNQANAGEIS
jgi:hypothetical protein